jgi:5-methylcytosine-specific restriction endonuclease McrA
MDSASDESERSGRPCEGSLPLDGGILGEAEADPSRTPTPLSGPLRFSVQFTASEEYVKLVEEAQALLSHVVPSRDLAEVHLRAMRALVVELKKRKYAVLGATVRRDSVTNPPSAEPLGNVEAEVDSPDSRPNVESGEHYVVPRSEASVSEDNDSEAAVDEASQRPLACDHPTEHPRRRDRYIPAAVRRAVFARDGGRCCYVDELGTRCCETARLEFHHAIPFARAGAHDEANLSLRCTQHNALAAEEDFGREFVAQRRSSGPHARWGDER